MNNRFVEIICLLLLVLFFSCSKEVGEVASSDQTYTYKLDMSASLSTYDDEPCTRAGLTFVKGDIIYLCFNPGSSDNEVYGTASYDGYTWNLTTTESLDFATSGYCNAKYFAGAKSYTSTKVEFDQYSEVYRDYTSWDRNGSSVKINVSLTPVFARIRFKGDSGTTFQLSGISWCSEYRHEKNYGYYLGNKSPMTVTIQSSGYSPYIYGYFTSSTSPSLTIVSNDVTYTMSCDNSMFQQGQSGWLNLPTRTSHTGWTSSADESDPYPVAGAVDLGLPSGILWSSWNMGASEVGEYGGYYCWGDASGECKTSQEYNIPNGTDNICGDPKFDMATVQWGVGAPDGHTWRLPYVSEFDELFANSIVR